MYLTCGCTGTTPSNATTHQIIPPTIHATLVMTTQSLMVSPTQINTEITTPITTVPTIMPHFTGTITYGSNKLTYGSNQSPPLTEDQAWKYAEDYLANFEMMNGLSILWSNGSQKIVTPLGQGKHTYENNTQTWTWSYRVDRCSIEGGNCYSFEIITIDANDGHLIGLWLPD